MPARFPLVDKEPWRTNGIRKMPVKNFVVYYCIDESKKEVWITAVVYSKRDQLNALKEMP
jgi:toxin ParE1/3/4